MAKIAEARRDPGRVVEVLQNCGSKHWCKRAMMQEPHCLNTSILDCSVTFTVDKDVWIHGIEVPSQVTDVPEQLMVRNGYKIVQLSPSWQFQFKLILIPAILILLGYEITWTVDV